jgi:chemotaxis protein histidine kinase CheA
VDPDFADLVPLFVSEARGRLERLLTLGARVAGDPGATAEARRELHTLKGAGRMLRLTGLAELCHAAESALQHPTAGVERLLTRVVDRLSAMVDAVAAGVDPVQDPGLVGELAGGPRSRVETGEAAAESQVPSFPPAPTPAGADLRLDADTVNTMADRATRLRILARAGQTFVSRLEELAGLADSGTTEEQPAQILAVLSSTLRRMAVELEASSKRLARAADQQLDAFLALQIQPLRGFMVGLARHARELARSLGREVEVQLVGEDTKLDRRIVGDLEEALLHLLRNAVDHGVESVGERLAAGKPAAGQIRITAEASAARVKLSISDDGRGIDPSRVVDAAIKAGLVDREKARDLQKDQVLRLLLHAGFTTRPQASELSGRGIGLDAVAAIAARAGGSVAVESELQRGTTVSLEVPAARRGEEVMVLRVGRTLLALPVRTVSRVDGLAAAEIHQREGLTFARIGGRLTSFVDLPALLGEAPRERMLMLSGRHAGEDVALTVDDIAGVEEVLLRPLAGPLAGHPFLEGVALLSSGQPVGVLSPAALAGGLRLGPDRRAAVRSAARRLRLLLVDDSFVTREMERRLLEDAGFDVRVANDAAEALEQLGEDTFDCVVTDVEMPGMDGFELTRHLRGIPTLAHIPVVIVSTHDRPEDRLRGLEAGADAYLAKQSLDAVELAAVVRRLGGR